MTPHDYLKKRLKEENLEGAEKDAPENLYTESQIETFIEGQKKLKQANNPDSELLNDIEKTAQKRHKGYAENDPDQGKKI